MIWIWLRDLECLKLASGCLQTLTVTRSKQQQLEKVLWDAWFPALENILKGKETILVSDPSTAYLETQANYLIWRKRPSPWCFVQYLILAFVLNKYSPNTILLISIQSNSTSQTQNRHDLLVIFRFMFSSFCKGLFYEFQKIFQTCFAGHVCSKSRGNFRHRM